MNEKNIKREERNRIKYKTWDDYKRHLLYKHSRKWYGVFDDSGLCCKCGLTVIGSFNLQVHHLSYSPRVTSFIHASCHNREYSYSEKERRDSLELIITPNNHNCKAVGLRGVNKSLWDF